MGHSGDVAGEFAVEVVAADAAGLVVVVVSAAGVAVVDVVV